MVTEHRFSARCGEGNTAIAIQKVLPIIGVNRSVRFKGCMPVAAIPEVEHGEAFFSCVNGDGLSSYYGPVTISCLMAVVASSLTVALASTVVSLSAYSCHKVEV